MQLSAQATHIAAAVLANLLLPVSTGPSPRPGSIQIYVLIMSMAAFPTPQTSHAGPGTSEG
jgi:hypothetical protein